LEKGKSQSEIDREREKKLDDRMRNYTAKEKQDAELFKVSDFLTDNAASEVQYIEIKGKVKRVEFGRLNLGDYIIINKIPDTYERAVHILWMMLKKVDKELKLEDLKNLGDKVATQLLDALTKDTPLETPKQSSAGSREADKHSS